VARAARRKCHPDRSRNLVGEEERNEAGSPLVVLAGVILVPVWGAPPAEACENCPCQGEGTGQVSRVMETLTRTEGPAQTTGPVVASNGVLTTVGKLAQAMTRRFGAGHLWGISMPVYWR
jgi:hypothetical protein